ncbi:DUF3616 domain-containing protein [Rhizobium sp. 32-5/1]|uniref:DUF3616 domain-containing protein n=1 Tax=Rhizobium sp. 32-5/1 TaxID=3019602 RepID=UPI00240D8F46|nr:DUF3616 domain-containing protein [Rhizobium sp. 32-5/1]WEZ82083.1 DUF3616 domain-containing protein [Rhizobium sp. 32-5/1]
MSETGIREEAGEDDASPGFTIYEGLIEASATVALDDTHFTVASDEINVLNIYRHGLPAPVASVDLKPFLGNDGCDIEAGARIGDRIYWITSHSRPQSGGNAKKRSVFFATRLDASGDIPVLVPEHQPFFTLRGLLKDAIGGAGALIDIEGLASTPDGHLLIGFRGPLDDNRAILVPLRNPADVVEQAAEPDLGPTLTLDLGGRGIRSIDATGIASPAYLILAGPMNDTKGDFALYEWDGDDTEPRQRNDVSLLKLTPEAVVVQTGQRTALILSDDGSKKRNDADTPDHQRRFRSLEITF